jgi:folylpolyglutamate synthase/dihydropteroate synthase
MVNNKGEKVAKEKDAEETQPEMSVLTRTAHEVMNGGWSQGKDRQKLLIDAGHNPYEVEEEVQRLQDEKDKAEKK